MRHPPLYAAPERFCNSFFDCDIFSSWFARSMGFFAITLALSGVSLLVLRTTSGTVSVDVEPAVAVVDADVVAVEEAACAASSIIKARRYAEITDSRRSPSSAHSRLANSIYEFRFAIAMLPLRSGAGAADPVLRVVHDTFISRLIGGLAALDFLQLVERRIVRDEVFLVLFAQIGIGHSVNNVLRLFFIASDDFLNRFRSEKREHRHCVGIAHVVNSVHDLLPVDFA